MSTPTITPIHVPLIQVPLAVIVRPPGEVLVTILTDLKAKEYGLPDKDITPGGKMEAIDKNRPQLALAREIEYQLGVSAWVGDLIAETQIDTHNGAVRENLMYFWVHLANTSQPFANPEPDKYERQEWVRIPDLKNSHSHPAVRAKLIAMYYAQYVN